MAIISLLIANTINAAADMQAIAAGINMLVPVPIIVLILPIASRHSRRSDLGHV